MKAHFKRTPVLPTIIGLMLLMPALITWLLLTAICYLTNCSSDFASLIIFAGLLCPLMSLGIGIVGRIYYENNCIYNKTLLVLASAFITIFFLIIFIFAYQY